MPTYQQIAVVATTMSLPGFRKPLVLYRYTDFAKYAVDPTKEPLLDLFLDEDTDPSGHAR